MQGDELSKFMEIVRRLGFNDYDKVRLGTVNKIEPLEIAIDGLATPLDGDFLVVAAHLTAHERAVKINGLPEVIAFDSALSPGDRVICVSANGGQTYIVLDKAITGGGA